MPPPFVLCQDSLAPAGISPGRSLYLWASAADNKNQMPHRKTSQGHKLGRTHWSQPRAREVTRCPSHRGATSKLGQAASQGLGLQPGMCREVGATTKVISTPITAAGGSPP